MKSLILSTTALVFYLMFVFPESTHAIQQHYKLQITNYKLRFASENSNNHQPSAISNRQLAVGTKAGGRGEGLGERKTQNPKSKPRSLTPNPYFLTPNSQPSTFSINQQLTTINYQLRRLKPATPYNSRLSTVNSQPSTINQNNSNIQSARLSIYQSIVLGLVEGVTEYLPVSSTGHLFLAERMMSIGRSGSARTAADSYAICIQIGAILAVVWLYFSRIRSMIMGLLGRDDNGRKMVINLSLAFLPAAIIGFVFEKNIKNYLFGIWPISAAWFIGGIVLIVVSLWRRDTEHGDSLSALIWYQALLIGVIQCLAMWPGTSRSLVTIIGGVLIGLNLSAAVEFSFLLGLVTLSAATIFEGIKAGSQIIAMFGWLNPFIGIIVAFISAAVSVKLMVSFLNRNTMVWFGIYRILLSLFSMAAILAGRL